MYAPKVLSVEDSVPEDPTPVVIENNKENLCEPLVPEVVNKHTTPEDEQAQPLMPWRSQLRKTNSTLNLLE
jgi:hypothetical protein